MSEGSQTSTKAVKRATISSRNVSSRVLANKHSSSNRVTNVERQAVAHTWRHTRSWRATDWNERLVGVEVRDPDTVKRVIADVPGMLEMLIDSVEELRRAYGERATRIAIEPFIDPEIANAEPRLFVLVVTTLPFAEADAILERVVSEWWTENANRAGGRVTIDMEFA